MSIEEQHVSASTNQRVIATEQVTENNSITGTKLNQESQQGSDSTVKEAQNNISNSAGTTDYAPTVITSEWLFAILGDKRTGLIAKLESETDQDFILSLLSGRLVESAMKEVKEWPEFKQLYVNLVTEYQALLDVFNLSADTNTSKKESQPVLLSNVTLSLIAVVKLSYQALLEFIKKLSLAALDFCRYVFELLYRFTKLLALSTDQLPELISDRIFPSVEYKNTKGERIITDSPPNLLCLLAALPVATLKILLSIPLEQLVASLESN